MAERIGVVLAGEGAIARRHMAALTRIDDVEVVGIAGGDAADTSAFAAEFGVARHGLDLGELLALPGVDAAVLTTPTQLHAAQAVQVMEAGKHVLVEIPMADSLADAEAVVAAQQRTGVTAMACHTRRFNPSHQWVHRRIAAGELTLQHLVVETFFFRRENKNALGKPRTWTDSLLWHHACHSVDLFIHQTGEVPAEAWAQQGPPHPDLGIAMDMTVGLRSPAGALCTLALSFNNDGPLGTTFRYIGDTGTFVASYDDLVDGYGKPVDVSGVATAADGIEVQDREFVASLREGREPEASVARCLPAMRTLDRLARML
ncbi:MAG TPA: Gfo/Idh/MocA family oxidoreductase [Acidimicrobiales bacterium]|jgi:2-hydroxy-4-carboxymuconate semialdehyde hemiacetal dehydrogenase|nr:Gfo/Idh/MocA family oxidoreductase [Acidimicrobiales bacterium]